MIDIYICKTIQMRVQFCIRFVTYLHALQHLIISEGHTVEFKPYFQRSIYQKKEITSPIPRYSRHGIFTYTFSLQMTQFCRSIFLPHGSHLGYLFPCYWPWNDSWQTETSNIIKEKFPKKSFNTKFPQSLFFPPGPSDPRPHVPTSQRCLELHVGIVLPAVHEEPPAAVAHELVRKTWQRLGTGLPR